MFHTELLLVDMSERDGCGDGLCSDGAPDFIPPRAPRGRRSGVILPGGGQDTDTILLESVKAAPRRSSIIKVKTPDMSYLLFWLSFLCDPLPLKA